MQSIVQITTTIDDQQAAEKIATALVQARLAACVQIIGPIHSTYRWQGEIESSREWMCVIKSTETRVDEIQAAIRQSHTYDVPEILVTPVVGGHGPYLDWVAESTKE